MELIATIVALLAIFAGVGAIAGWESRDGFSDSTSDSFTHVEP
jgi:hypothetical protein